MFKIIMLVKKKPEFDTEAFIARWQQHSEKVLGLKDVLNIRHYGKTLPFQAGAQPATRDDFQRARETEAGQAVLAALREDEAEFVDLQHSVMWFGEEERMI